MERLIAQPNIIRRGLAAGGLAVAMLTGATACLPHELQAAQDFCSTKPDPQQCLGTLATLSRGMSDEAYQRSSEINAGQTPSDAALQKLRGCEAGGMYSTVSKSGSYRGAYQFNQGTWDGVVGGTAHLPEFVGKQPEKAPPAVQDAAARILYQARGTKPWPICGKLI